MSEIRHAYNWSHSENLGQPLADMYPKWQGIPRRVITGVLAFSNGIQAGLHERLQEK